MLSGHRCCFEDAVTKELGLRLLNYPKMKAAMDKLPPKLLALSSQRLPVPHVYSPEGQHEQLARARILSATFTNPNDKDRVPALYDEYVSRIATTLMGTLALQQDASVAEGNAGYIPLLHPGSMPPAPRYAWQQLLLQVLERDDAGVATATKLIQVDDGHAAAFMGSSNVFNVSFDECVHSVLPWRMQQGASEVEQFEHDAQVLRSLSSRVAELAKLPLGHSKQTSEAMAALQQEAMQVKTDRLKRAASAVLKRHRGHWSGLGAALSTLASITVEVMQDSGAAGVRRYASGQSLAVRVDNGWVDAVVTHADQVGVHTLSKEGGQQLCAMLTPWRHAPRQLPLSEFEAAHHRFANAQLAIHSYITDALSGRKLDVLQQCVAINVGSSLKGQSVESPTNVKDASSLAEWLRTLHARLQAIDTSVSLPACALLTAGPAAGKTSLLSQVVVHLLNQRDRELLPIVVKVQLLQRRLLEESGTFATAWNWIDAYLCIEHGLGSATYLLLRQALMARRAPVLLDGLDEGGMARVQIERHVAEVLAPQGHIVLATSRPAGVSEVVSHFHQLQLSPLTDSQQQEVVQLRLGAERAEVLLPYLRNNVPLDGDTRQRITSNPLMLSMVISVFELRLNLGMPRTVTELYEVATSAMLQRAGEVVTSLVPMLTELFVEAHNATTRVLTTKHIEAAARRVGFLQGATQLQELVLHDRMPLLSLLQARPLQLQAAHLSFQEFFVARAICGGGVQLRLPPWQLGAFWSNTLHFGEELGLEFGRGLLQGVDVQGGKLDLVGQLGGHLPTSGRAVALMGRTLAEVSVDRGITLDMGQLWGIPTVSLPSRGLRDSSAAVIAGCMKSNAVLAILSLERNKIGDVGATAIGEGLKANAVLKEL